NTGSSAFADDDSGSCLKIESELSARRPGLEPGPITTGRSEMLRRHRLLAPQRFPVVMGPCVREDDTVIDRTTSHNHFSTIHAGAWSLAPSSPLISRSTPAFVKRGASAGLSSR